LSIRGPTAKALAENAFQVAIDADDGRIVKKIMEALESPSIIPDEDVIVIVRNLLQAGADAQAIAVDDNDDDDEVVTVIGAVVWRGSVE
jgi:hypothetical protein